jgi:hypothetical protein
MDNSSTRDGVDRGIGRAGWDFMIMLYYLKGDGCFGLDAQNRLCCP